MSAQPLPAQNPNRTEDLLKHGLADQLRAEIVNGSLAPGHRIVERVWAQKYGVAQASIREAINILEKNGFVTKRPGQTAEVINFTELDIVQVYQVRAALEGMAAHLAALLRPDVSVLNSLLQGMRAAIAKDNADELVTCDLNFHLEICRLAGNPHLEEHAVRVLKPFFAFFRLRLSKREGSLASWHKDVDAHRRIVDLIADGEGDLVEFYIKKGMRQFALTAKINSGPSGLSNPLEKTNETAGITKPSSPTD